MAEMVFACVYTCRLCGRTFEKGDITKRQNEAYEYLADSIQGDPPMAVHDCRESTFGIADLIGLKPKEPIS